MKITKNYHNSLKYYLLNKKTYKLFLVKSNFQLVKSKNIELQLKKIIKLFFKIMYKNIFLLNFNINFKLLTQFKQKTVLYKKKLSNLNTTQKQHKKANEQKNKKNHTKPKDIQVHSFGSIMNEFNLLTYLLPFLSTIYTIQHKKESCQQPQQPIHKQSSPSVDQSKSSLNSSTLSSTPSSTNVESTNLKHSDVTPSTDSQYSSQPTMDYWNIWTMS